MVTITKQEARDLILKCYKECISDNITELDISFDSSSPDLTCIKVKIPEKQQPTFRVLDTFNDSPAVRAFGNLIGDNSLGILKLVKSNVHIFAEEGHFFHKVLSFNIDCNCQLEEWVGL